MKVLLVCHAGAGLGLGHLTRTLVVARALYQDLGAIVHVLVQGDPVVRDDLAGFPHRFIALQESLVDAIWQYSQAIDAQLLAFDLHPRCVPADIGKLFADLRRDQRKLIAVDGLLSYNAQLDLFFMPSFCCTAAEVASCSTPILFGWDCFLLNVQHQPVADWQPGSRVLALAGGSDATNLGQTWPTQLNEQLAEGTQLDWVTGPFAQQPVWPTSPRISMLNHSSPTSLDNLCGSANYAVTVYGVSFFELLYYGLPTVVFSPYGNKDDEQLAEIARQGVALVASNELDAIGKLKELMADHVLAQAISQRGRQKLSQSGGHKFAEAAAKLLSK